MTTETRTSTDEHDERELLPGYYLDELGAWLTLPWPGDRSLPWSHPKRMNLLPPSLGRQVIAWGHTWLIDPLTGEPWRWHPAQARFLQMWYSIRPDGRWVWRSGVKRGAKGTGKDPMLAGMALGELCGPVRWTGEFAQGGERAAWNPDFEYRKGEPIGVPHRMALVQIAANSEAQAKDPLRVANAMMSRRAREEYGYDGGVTQATLETLGRIELLTSSEATAEGDPATAIFLNETHHMKSTNGGQAIAAVARRNVAKSPNGLARLCEFTNAHLPGEDSVAEASFDAWQLQVAGHTRRADILYDSREAAPHLSLAEEEELELGIAQAYADSPWTDQERMRDEAQDPRTPVQDSIRFYFNALPTNEMAWVDPRRFDALARPDEVVEDGEPIALFLDCSKSEDATVLVGCRISDGHVMSLGCWQRPHGDRGKGWLAPRHEVDAKVRETFDRYAVQWYAVDPSPARDDTTEAEYWAEMVDQWHRDFRRRVLIWATPGDKNGSAVKFDMRLSAPGARERNRLFTEEAMLCAALIDPDVAPEDLVDPEENPSLTWDGDSLMRTHVHNARRRPNQWGVSLGKQTRDSKKLVDYAVAMVGARLGRRLVLNSGKKLKRKKTRATGRVLVLD